MSIFYRSQYTFNKKNQNFINALMRFKDNVWITHIDGVELDARSDLTCRNLPKAIQYHNERSKNDEVTIQCRSADARSTIDVFPRIDAKELLAGMDETLKNKNLSTIHKNEYIESISFYISFQTSKNDLYLVPPVIPAFNKEEVFILLYELNKLLNISGAVHLPELKSIVFQHEASNYVLSYDGNSGFHKLSPFALDLDDGFCDKEADEPSLLLKALNKHFNRWKDNNYVGDIFPANEIVKYYNTGKNNVLQMGLFIQPVIAPQQAAFKSVPVPK